MRLAEVHKSQSWTWSGKPSSSTGNLSWVEAQGTSDPWGNTSPFNCVSDTWSQCQRKAGALPVWPKQHDDSETRMKADLGCPGTLRPPTSNRQLWSQWGHRAATVLLVSPLSQRWVSLLTDLSVNMRRSAKWFIDTSIAMDQTPDATLRLKPSLHITSACIKLFAR